MPWLETAPLWVVWLVLTALLIGAEEAGMRLQAYLARGGDRSKGGDGVNYLVSAALALLGLLIAFTFSLASSRYDQRRQLVVAEANAIGTTYLRYQLLDEPARTELSRLMIGYGEARHEYSAVGADRDKQAQATAGTKAQQARIWAALRRAVRQPSGSALATPMLNATNDMFDVASTRSAAREARVPITIVRTLIIYAVVCAFFMGYGLTGGRRHFVVSVALFFLLSLAIVLILDLDRPRSGTLMIDQAPLEQVIADMKQSEAALERER